MELERLRKEIADVDREIVVLAAKRLHLAEEVGLEKRLLGRPLRDESMEELVKARIRTDCSSRGIRSSFAAGLADVLIEESLHRQDGVRLPTPAHRGILVVGGAGRMGRWLCRYFRSCGYDVAVNDIAGPSEPFPFEADLEMGVQAADVIAVSVPMSVAAQVLRKIAALKPKALVFDVCSLKAPIAGQLESMARMGLQVASVHPVFGPNLWPLSGGAITFSDCGNPGAVHDAKELFRSTGANLVDLSLDRHDELMAAILGLSHLCLLAFARGLPNSAPDLRELQRAEGTTFIRLSRAVADLLADPPALLRDVQALNPRTRLVHRHVREALDEWEKATMASDDREFLRLLEQARGAFGGDSA